MAEVAEPALWACVLEDAEIYTMGLASREAAIAALEGHAGEIICYERGFPSDVAEELFDVDRILSHAEEIGLAGGSVLGQYDNGLFDAAREGAVEDLRRRLAAAFVEWIARAELPIWRVIQREEVELPTDAKDRTA